MSVHDRLHIRREPTTPSLEAAVRRRDLPPDLVVAGARRLGFVAVIYAIAYAISYGSARLTHGEGIEQLPTQEFADALSMASILFALAVAIVVFSGKVGPRLLLDFGLVFWFVGALGIDLGFHYWTQYMGIPIVGLSWVCPWLVIYPLLVPNTPGKVTIGAIATASVGPLAYLIAGALVAEPMVDPAQLPYPFLPTAVETFLPYYLNAVIAVIGSRIVYKLGTDAAEAREMGSYRLVKPLGQGGMGEVWLAKHRMLARPAAVKLIRPEVLGASSTDPSGVRVVAKRFHREAEAIAALRSPHTVNLYDFGTTDDGNLFYAMELLEGLSLEALVKRFGPLPPGRVIFLLRQVCDSLDDAHAHHLVHRDIKPSNIYACHRGRYCDYVKVLDFGLVKHGAQAEGEDLTRLTSEGITAGTPAYMAPELALGKEPLDGRADIYSLGCVAYWLLTGQTIFAGESAVDLIVKHVQEAPVPPSRRTETEIDDGLEEIIMRCLEKDPARRPQTALDLNERLAECGAKDPWTQADSERWWRLHQPVEPTDLAQEIDSTSSPFQRPTLEKR